MCEGRSEGRSKRTCNPHGRISRRCEALGGGFPPVFSKEAQGVLRRQAAPRPRRRPSSIFCGLSLRQAPLRLQLQALPRGQRALRRCRVAYGQAGSLPNRPGYRSGLLATADDRARGPMVLGAGSGAPVADGRRNRSAPQPGTSPRSWTSKRWQCHRSPPHPFPRSGCRGHGTSRSTQPGTTEKRRKPCSAQGFQVIGAPRFELGPVLPGTRAADRAAPRPTTRHTVSSGFCDRRRRRPGVVRARAASRIRSELVRMFRTDRHQRELALGHVRRAGLVADEP